MSTVSHADVIGIVLFLILGAVSYYFYARITQLERKVGLMENILFDLKITTEQAMNVLTETEVSSSKVDTIGSSGIIGSMKSMDFLDRTESIATEDVLPVSMNMSDTKELTVLDSPRTRTPTQSLRVDRSDTSSQQTSSPVESSQSSGSVSSNYEAMTYKELTQLAKQRGLSGLRNASKAQVIEALRNRDNGTTTSTPQAKAMDISTWMQDSTPLEDQSNDGIKSAQDGGFNGTLLESSEVDVSLVESS